MPASSPEDAPVAARLVKAYCGPSPYSKAPCVVAALSFEPAVLAEAIGRCNRMAEACRPWFEPPQLAWQTASLEQDLAAFVAAWSLAILNKGGGLLQSAYAFRENGCACACVDHHNEQVTFAAIQLSMTLLEQIDTLGQAKLEQALQAFWQLARQHHPDFQIVFLMRAARAAGIPFSPFLREHRLWRSVLRRIGQRQPRLARRQDLRQRRQPPRLTKPKA